MHGPATESHAVPFNRPTYLGWELENVEDALAQPWLSGGGKYTALCEELFTEMLGCRGAFLTPSCTSALEMAAIILGIQPGDEVIMPSFTFVSTANAFVIFGARAVFVDVDPCTMNIDPRAIEQAITPRTRAIVVVHYGGVVCEMDAILEIAGRHEIAVVEDAAHAIGSTYKARPAGTLGALGAFSFHETKNITSGGEGGLLVINDERHLERARVVWDKGTNRAAFREGRVDKYTWIDRGSSFRMNEVSAACLWAQVNHLAEVNGRRALLQGRYREALDALRDAGHIEMQAVPETCTGNGHLFFLKTKGPRERRSLLSFLAARQIQATFHYVPLHTSPAGLKWGRFAGSDEKTTCEAERLLRLPLFYNMTDAQQTRVIDAVLEFFTGEAPREK